MVSLLEEFANSERQLLVIAEDIKGDALDALVMNKERGSLKARMYGYMDVWIGAYIYSYMCAVGACPSCCIRARRASHNTDSRPRQP